MILRTLIVTGAVLAVAAPALAQTAAPTAPAGTTLQQFQTKNGDKLMARLDANKDGKISSEEFSTFRKKAPEAEAKAAPEGRAGRAGKLGDRMFARFDTDNDGYLSRTEANALLAMRFKRMDANNDGVLSLEELSAKGGRAKVGV